MILKLTVTCVVSSSGDFSGSVGSKGVGEDGSNSSSNTGKTSYQTLAGSYKDTLITM